MINSHRLYMYYQLLANKAWFFDSMLISKIPMNTINDCIGTFENKLKENIKLELINALRDIYETNDMDRLCDKIKETKEKYKDII